MLPYETTEWSHVESSSLIVGVGIREGDLVVRFKNGDAYLYPNLAGHYAMLLGAESVGKYFHKEIRHQQSRRLPRE